MSKTVAEVIQWATEWLENPTRPDPTTEAELAANQFAYVAWVLFTERRVALDALSKAGIGYGTLNERIQSLIVRHR